jgi:hypothetical protein
MYLGPKDNAKKLGESLAQQAQFSAVPGKDVKFNATFTVTKDGDVHLTIGEEIVTRPLDHADHSQQVYPSN